MLNPYCVKRRVVKSTTEGLFIAKKLITGLFITAPKLRPIESRKMIQITARGPDIRFHQKNI